MEGILQSHDSYNSWVQIQHTQEMAQMFTAFHGLKGELKKDGNQWCATSGEWPVHNISGFGNSPAVAMEKWYAEYFKVL